MHFDLRINSVLLARVEIQRHERLDLTNQAAIADRVCTYDVRLDGRTIGQVKHRYGDLKWPLVRAAIELIEEHGL